MGPIQALMSQMMRDPEMRMMLEQQMAPRDRRSAFVPYGYSEPSGPMPQRMAFRDTAQAGPAPPTADGPIVSMFRGSR